MAKMRGSRTVFFNYLLLPDGRTAAAALIPEITEVILLSLTGYSQPQITPDSGE